jgi:hypothetical protein
LCKDNYYQSKQWDIRKNSGLSGCAQSVFAGDDCLVAFSGVFKRSFKPLAALKLGMGKAKRFESR